MMTDPIADMLTRIKNAYMARHKDVEIPYSRYKEELAHLLSKEEIVERVTISGDVKKSIHITLLYRNSQPALTEVTRVSKPGRRVYVKKHEVPRVLGGEGIAVLSTPMGLMTDMQAKKKGLGGEILCKLW